MDIMPDPLTLYACMH